MTDPREIASLPYMQPGPRCLFDPRGLHRIAQLGVGQPPEEAFAQITAALAECYPGHICTQPDWIFNVAGGAMGQMTLYASLREYLIFFGTCIGTEGHSGRYRSEVYEFMIQGEMLCEYEGRFEPETQGPGPWPTWAPGRSSITASPARPGCWNTPAATSRPSTSAWPVLSSVRWTW